MRNDQNRPLEPGDSATRTSGCRHSNPDICRNNLTPEKCAFARKDNICLLPPRSWPHIFEVLLSGKTYRKNPTKKRNTSNAGN